jgi:hypothetical protein
MSSIKAKVVCKTMSVELPLGNGSLSAIDKFLKEKGFTFNGKGQFECEYVDAEGDMHAFSLHIKSTLRRTIIITMQGDIFPWKTELRKIAQSMPKCCYILEGDGIDSDNVIKTLFEKDFEIVALNENGIVQTFKRKDNEVQLLYKVDNKFKLVFKGFENISRTLLAAFSIS